MKKGVSVGVSELTSVLNAMNTTDMAPWGAANTALPRQRASMMQWWADYLDAQLAMGEESQEGANWKRDAAHTETAGTKPRGSIKPQIARHVRALKPTA